ncbi:MAG: helix-turn-helix domain-containing protein [Candidatus Pacebacteria bacterium]|jgi:cytoskeletal protein RodZ|nr:helix-turn-helix domain-containing protein [Candidatus Paceibacterota bacterium]MBT4652409.1 helix-turn-helix domain-containing protein [Candidatus Paceibacterota bacterium]MBT6756236.1 helix-turn-helix domain-containing protein [Candidatus Paceibacterota bacterium]MBT6921527.1 helix-turn-helix domain-containing protein [Candidatus Paceibacterota bacterium]
MIQQTKTVGELLKLEREKRRVSRTQLAQEIRVKEGLLYALEENRFKDLPASVFVKGYIKAYARVLNFDPDPMLALLRRDFKEGNKGKLVPQEFLKSSRAPFLSSVRFALLGGISVFLVLFAYIAIRWYSFISPPKITITSPVENAVVSPQVTIKGLTEPEAKIMINSQVIDVQSDGYFETNITLPNEGMSTITVESIDRQEKKNTEQRTVFVRF